MKKKIHTYINNKRLDSEVFYFMEKQLMETNSKLTENDVEILLHELVKENREKQNPISKIVFRNPVTIVFWKDGTETTAVCSKEDTFSKEIGLAVCACKKMLGENVFPLIR